MDEQQTKDKQNDFTKTVRHKMTGWYAPGQLINTGVQVLISDLLGTRSDYRVIESFAAAPVTYDYSGEPELWLDYVADVGDGWDSTYTLASLLAHKTLSFGKQQTQRGRILIMGGDEVYPVASRDNYREKLVGPYECAHPHSDPPHPVIFAVPGNHDWYDGLISFTRLFCQERWFGGWQTKQHRSYFAIKLPHRWWLWGVDLQLESDIDQPQLDYFGAIAENQVKPGDHVILATAEPDWIYGNIYDPKLQKNIAYLEEKIIEGKAQAKLMIAIAGDLHHYRRHQGCEETNVQLITSGGGGAFLHPTIGQPVDIIRIGKDRTRKFALKAEFPSQQTSRRLVLRDLTFPFYNPTFGLLTGLIYLLGAGTFGVWSKPGSAGALMTAVLGSPSRVSWIVLIIAGFMAFTDTHSRAYKYIAGGLHGLANLAGIVVSGWTATWIVGTPPQGSTPFGHFIAVVGIVFGFGYVVSSLIMGIYLYVSLRVFGRHANEAFSALHIADYKNFVRFHINPQGNVTIYPIGIEKVPKQWVKPDNPLPEEPRLVPSDRTIEPVLIEQPIIISGPGPGSEQTRG